MHLYDEFTRTYNESVLNIFTKYISHHWRNIKILPYFTFILIFLFYLSSFEIIIKHFVGFLKQKVRSSLLKIMTSVFHKHNYFLKVLKLLFSKFQLLVFAIFVHILCYTYSINYWIGGFTSQKFYIWNIFTCVDFNTKKKICGVYHLRMHLNKMSNILCWLKKIKIQKIRLV